MAPARRLAAVLVLALSALLLVAAAGATTGSTFVSKRYGYSLTLPGRSSDWQRRPALMLWSSGGLTGLDSPAFDGLDQLHRGWTVVIAGRRLSQGTTLRKWTTTVAAMTPSGCQTPRVFEKSKLDQGAARVFRHSCSDGVNVTKLTAVHRGHGYLVLFASDTTNPAASNRRFFGALRRSFRFTH